MAEEKWERVKVRQIVRGFPCSNLRSSQRRNVEDAMDFVPGDGDLLIAGYPKTGSTWMQYIVLQIRSKGEMFPSVSEVLYRFAPFVELTGIESVKKQDKFSIYKHHIPYNMVQKNDESKCIYIYRNPEDVFVSYYHFSRNMYPEINFDFNECFEYFVTGDVPYGNYFEHVLSFYKHREDDNLLMVSYEKLLANRRKEILRIAKFIGEEHYKSLLQDRELLDKIIRHTSFDYMKQNLTFPNDFRDRQCKDDSSKVDFFRKGIVGDGKSVLTESQREHLQAAAEKLLNGTFVMTEWYPK